MAGGAEVETSQEPSAPDVSALSAAPPAEAFAGLAGAGAGARDASLGVARARALAPLIGNRAMARVLARDPVAEGETAKASVKGPSAHRPTMQWEASFKREVSKAKNKSISGKLTFARWGDSTDTKAVKLGGAEVEWTEQQPEGTQRTGAIKGGLSLFEQKATRERAAGKVAHKVQSTLANLELGGDPIWPGVNFKFNVKALEYQINHTKNETDLNLLTVSGALEGNITEWVQQAMDIPIGQRARWRVVVAGEFKWVPSYEELARIKSIWKANKVIEAEARAIKETAEKLRSVEWHRKDMARELKRGRGQVEHLQKQLDEAPETLKKLRGEKLERAKGRLAKLEARDKELREAGDKLADALKKSTKNMDEALETAAKASKGMKTKIGKRIAKTMATKSAKVVGKLLAKAIPIINVVSAIYDLYEIGTELDKWRRGGKWDPFGSGEDSGGTAVEGATEGGGGPEGSPDGPPGGEHDPSGQPGGSGTGDGKPGGSVPDGGSGTGEGDGGSGGSGGGKGGADAGENGAGGGGGGSGIIVPEPPGVVPDPGVVAGEAPDTPKQPEPALHEKARSVLDIVRGNQIPIDAEVASQLGSVVPKGLTDAQLAELRLRIEKLKGEGLTDPYEIVGRIHQEIDRVVKGEPAVEASVNGKHDAANSTPGTPPVGGALPGGDGKATEGTAKDGKKGAPAPIATPAPATATKKAEPPKTIRPPIPTGFFLWNDAEHEVVIPDAKRDELLGMEFNLGGGLVVGVTDITLSNEKFPEFTMVSITFEVMVLNAPTGAAADYPWKPGVTKSYTERAARNLKSGSFAPIEDAPAQQAAFTDALSYEGGKMTLKRKGTIVEWPGATLRIDGLAGEPTVRADDKKEIHTVDFLVTPIKVTDPQAMIVADGGPILLKLDVQVTVSVEVTITKKKK
jgi:hypothetical protein